MMKKPLLLHLTLSWGVICLPSLAYPMDERVALMLAGTACLERHAALEWKLAKVPGVRQIDLHAVPGHVLVDVNTAVVDVDSLATHVNDILAAQSPCHATIMKSCISADLRVTSGRVTREASSIAQLDQ
jgi:hypothetical protein